MDVTCIHYINETNHLYINDKDNYMHKYYEPFLSSKSNKYISSGSEYDSAKGRFCRQKKIILNLLLKKSKSF